MSERDKQMEAYFIGLTSVQWSPIMGLEASGFEESTHHITLEQLADLICSVNRYHIDLMKIHDKVKNL